MAATLKERLLKGAGVLGEFWRGGDRCREGWRAVECSCDPKGRFCRSKARWLDLAIQDGRIPYEGEYDLGLLMRASEWDATGLEMKVENREAGIVRVGTGAAAVTTMRELWRIAKAPESLPSMLAIFKEFPGSRVSSVEEEKPPARLGNPLPSEEVGG